MKARDARLYLVLAAIATVVLWQFHYGRMALYPFSLFATFAHEMGHGLTALLMGASLDELVMYPDGSGFARWRGHVGRLGRGAIAAGGLVGPSIVGSLVLVLGKNPRRARWLLRIGAALMGVIVIFFARGWFAPVFLAMCIGVFLLVAHFAPERGSPFFLQLLGVQLCLAIFKDLDYMFSEGGRVGGVLRASDSAAIADALFLPYWFWGGLTAAFSFVVLVLGLWISLRSKTEKSPASADRAVRA